jgi:hypothetical protein
MEIASILVFKIPITHLKVYENHLEIHLKKLKNLFVFEKGKKWRKVNC